MLQLINWLILIILIAIVVLWVIPGILTAIIVVAYLIWLFVTVMISINDDKKLRNKIKRDMERHKK
jgi:uncharacterized membrane protein YhaH (DUF805 family)